MKVAIVTNEASLESTLSNRFGRAPYFLVFTPGDDDYQFIANESQNATGGAGVQAAQLLVDAHVKRVIAPKVGPKAWRVLTAAHIEVWQGQPGPVKTNIEALSQGTLHQMEAANGLSHSF